MALDTLTAAPQQQQQNSGAISPFTPDAFKQSQAYQDLLKSQEGMIGTADMYESPYFGLVSSGARGRQLDTAYENWKNSQVPNATTTTTPQPQGATNMATTPAPFTPVQSTPPPPLAPATASSLPGSAITLPLPAATASNTSTSGFTQGAPLPNITTSQQQQTVAPSFYTDYLSNLATQGAQAAQKAKYVGAQPLQQQAFQNVAQNVGNYQPALEQAQNLATAAGQDYAGNIANFMSPYTQQVVDALGKQGQQQIQQYLAPAATSAAVGSGQFGSARGAGALGQAINQGLLNTQQLQSQALQQGYGQALQAAQNQAQQKLASAQQLGSIAGQQQALGLGDVNALATLGGQQQTIAQNEQLFPMQQLTNESALLRNYTIPTSQNQTYTGPIPGAYQASPLQQIAGLGTLAAGIGQTDLGKYLGGALSTLGSSLKTQLGNLFSGDTQPDAGNLAAGSTDSQGNPVI